MKTKLTIISLILLGSVCVPAYSAVSVERSTSNEYIINSGYSKAIAESIDISKARSAGREYYTPDEQAYRNSSPIVKFLRKFYMYTDPAAEDYSMYHHDTKVTPHYTDF